MDNQNEWELYGLSEEEWNALTEEEREAFRKVGEEDSGEEPDPAQAGEGVEEVEL